MSEGKEEKEITSMNGRSFTWPLLLVVIGSLWLLWTLGLPIVWAVVWPALLIFVGIMFFIDRNLSAAGTWGLLGVVVSIMLVAGAWQVMQRGEFWGWEIGDWLGEKIETTDKFMAIEKDETGAVNRVSFNTDIGSHYLKLQADANRGEGKYWVDTKATYNYRDLDPMLEFDYSNRILTTRYEIPDRWYWRFAELVDDYTVWLTQPATNHAVEVKVGSGHADLLLGDLALETGEVFVGSGLAIVDFKGENLARNPVDFKWRLGSGEIRFFNVADSEFEKLNGVSGSGETFLSLGKALMKRMVWELELGSGDVELEIPSGQPFKVVPTGGSGEVYVNGEVRDGEYKTDDYDGAPNELKVVVEMGSGDLHVQVKGQ